MGRSSRADAAKHREDVVGAASRLFREHGVRGVSVPDVMSEAGLTHGGFYKQFESKEALFGEATEFAFDGLRALMEKYDSEENDDHEAAQASLAEFYLSPANRDDFAEGCPTAGLGADVAREKQGSPARSAYANGATDFASWMSDGDEPDFATISTMVGALVLARATAGTPLSDRILTEALAALKLSQQPSN